MRLIAKLRSPQRAPLLQVVKSAIALVIAWPIAAALVPGLPPVFAAVAAVLVVQPSVSQSLTDAIERSFGVIAGVILASALGLALGDGTWVALLASVLALAIAWMFRVTSATANQVAISALLVLAVGTATLGYAINRVLETILGAMIGIVVNMIVVPPVAVAPAQRAVSAMGTGLADVMDRLAEALEKPLTPAELAALLHDARQIRTQRSEVGDAIELAADTLTINPRSRNHRESLARIQDTLDQLRPVSTQTVGMIRAVVDHYDPSLTEEPVARDIAEQLRRAAHDIRALVRGTETAQPARPQPALTSQLSINGPSSSHWVLFGALLEDLRRIHLELTTAPPISDSHTARSAHDRSTSPTPTSPSPTSRKPGTSGPGQHSRRRRARQKWTSRAEVSQPPGTETHPSRH